MSGIYLHIPFCRQACNYCDFYFSTDLRNKQPLVETILKEIEIRNTYLNDKHISSIYFGGGTPSLLTHQELSMIFDALQRYFSWDSNIEITLEVNPDDINADVLRSWLTLGINRLSIGLQSFNDDELKWMNRSHQAQQSISAVKMAQEVGFLNISIDLIYGSKFQDLLSWRETLQQALVLDIQHISAYNLTIENKTILGLKHQKGSEPAVDDSLSAEQFLMLIEVLENAGFVQYEISNFAKPDYFAVHNSNYWRQSKYLGLGPSAHSFNGSSRQWNVKNNSLYMRALNDGSDFFEKEVLSLKDQYNEYVLTRLRTLWGCDLKEMHHLFGEATCAHFSKMLNKIDEYLIEKDGVILLTKAGKLKADGIASSLFL
jgi:oxygen-independent coproporphyrinogen III oxidase